MSSSSGFKIVRLRVQNENSERRIDKPVKVNEKVWPRVGRSAAANGCKRLSLRVFFGVRKKPSQNGSTAPPKVKPQDCVHPAWDLEELKFMFHQSLKKRENAEKRKYIKCISGKKNYVGVKFGLIVHSATSVAGSRSVTSLNCAPLCHLMRRAVHLTSRKRKAHTQVVSVREQVGQEGPEPRRTRSTCLSYTHARRIEMFPIHVAAGSEGRQRASRLVIGREGAVETRTAAAAPPPLFTWRFCGLGRTANLEEEEEEEEKKKPGEPGPCRFLPHGSHMPPIPFIRKKMRGYAVSIYLRGVIVPSGTLAGSVGAVFRHLCRAPCVCSGLQPQQPPAISSNQSLC
ncbi:hypothetical protein F2P81_004183 [Scophthalmus maximus]|uniref:Uncharacterized protein n=1 Tax=Scophthalmus maximus TaxID=52904 RepID=A0A6A4T5I8_SCOMX|nr:hypothetical protein F2P81_004183 [Scophthalmus maximus]